MNVATRNRTRLGGLLVLVVAGVVMAGAAGWVATGHWFGGGAGATQPPAVRPEPATEPTSDTAGRGRPSVVPFDLTTDLPATDSVTLLGQDSGVVVFAIVDASKACRIRGVSLATGQVLWTYGSPWGWYGFKTPQDNGKLALWMTESRGDLYPIYHFVIIAIQTGRIVSDRAFGPRDNPGGVPFWRLVAYFDGTVVVEYLSAMITPVGVVAYRDDNPDTPLWRKDGDLNAYDDGPLLDSDRVLPGGWIAALTGWDPTYVSIRDGSPLGRVFHDRATNDYHIFMAAGDVVVEQITYGGSHTPGRTILRGWRDITDPAPAWTDELGNGTEFELRVGCRTTDAAVFHEAIRAADDWVATLEAIRPDNGQALWSLPLVGSSDSRYVRNAAFACAALSRGDQELVAVAHSQGVTFVDAVTGVEYGRWAGQLDLSFPNDYVAPIGENLVLVESSDSADWPDSFDSFYSIRVLDFSDPDVKEVWKGGADWISGYIRYAGSVAVARATPDHGYEFLVW